MTSPKQASLTFRSTLSTAARAEAEAEVAVGDEGEGRAVAGEVRVLPGPRVAQARRQSRENAGSAA